MVGLMIGNAGMIRIVLNAAVVYPHVVNISNTWTLAMKEVPAEPGRGGPSRPSWLAGWEIVAGPSRAEPG